MGRKIAIFDLDGCISDDHWRRDQLPSGNPTQQSAFDLYHWLGRNDPPVNMEVLAARIDEGYDIMFVTARPEEIRSQTIAWLDEHAPPRDSCEWFLLMRPNFNMIGSVELKKELVFGWARSDANDISQIKLAYDDRPDICAMYNSIGIRGIVLDCPSIAKNPFDLGTAGVPEILEGMAATFRERNEVYKDNYKVCADVMAALFPEGVPPDIAHSYEFGLMYMVIGKLTRFVASDLKHADSAHDMAIYAALIEHSLGEVR